MSHTVTVKMIADQGIKFEGRDVNIRDIETIYVDAGGQILGISYGVLSDKWLREYYSLARGRRER